MKIDTIRAICALYGKEEKRDRYRMPDNTIVETLRAGVNISRDGIEWVHYHPADIFGGYGTLFVWIDTKICVPILHYPCYKEV